MIGRDFSPSSCPTDQDGPIRSLCLDNLNKTPGVTVTKVPAGFWWHTNALLCWRVFVAGLLVWVCLGRGGVLYVCRSGSGVGLGGFFFRLGLYIFLVVSFYFNVVWFVCFVCFVSFFLRFAWVPGCLAAWLPAWLRD